MEIMYYFSTLPSPVEWSCIFPCEEGDVEILNILSPSCIEQRYNYQRRISLSIAVNSGYNCPDFITMTCTFQCFNVQPSLQHCTVQCCNEAWKLRTNYFCLLVSPISLRRKHLISYVTNYLFYNREIFVFYLSAQLKLFEENIPRQNKVLQSKKKDKCLIFWHHLLLSYRFYIYIHTTGRRTTDSYLVNVNYQLLVKSFISQSVRTGSH